MWDSAGQEKFKSITKNLFNRVQGIIILYDITNKKSFLNVPNWIKLIQETTNYMIPYTLAGTKCDLNNEREVEEEEGIKLSQENKIDFMETSAKNNINIMECINTFVKNIVNSENFMRNISFGLQKISLYKQDTVNKSEKCC